MFEAAEVLKTVDKETFAREAQELRTELLEAQRALRSAGRSVVVIVSGVEGSRKSEVVNRLCEWLDARGVRTHAFWDVYDNERERPHYWRFWRRMPPRGTIGLMFGSWYTRPIIERAFGRLNDAELELELGRIEAHEHLLARDGTVFVKLWFHLSKEGQLERLRKIDKASAKDAKANERKGKKEKKKEGEKEKKKEGEKGRGKREKGKKEKKGKKERKGKKDEEAFESADDEPQEKTKEKKRAKGGKKGWKLSPLVREFAPLYDTFSVVSEHAIRRTHTDLAPWHVIGAACSNHRDLSAGRVLLAAIRQATTPVPVRTDLELPQPSSPTTVLDGVDLEARLERDEYHDALSEAQTRLNRLVWELRSSRKSCVAVFEGWDAAGKGGAIRRVAAPVDARLYRVVPIAAPTDEERAQHYLWRFWRHIPGAGKLRVFDRSWYGRVLVERVEGFARTDEWVRAYREITDFEEQLVEHGYGVAKFWLHISKEEQLARFEEREKIPWKQHKITPEDWRNRERWDDYVRAIDDMVARTSTRHAPWTLVAGNCKRWARVQIVQTLCETIERCLER